MSTFGLMNDLLAELTPDVAPHLGGRFEELVQRGRRLSEQQALDLASGD